MAAIHALLDGMKPADASDLHLKSDTIPRYRIDGDLHDVTGYGELNSKLIETLVHELIDERQKACFESDGVLHFSFGRENVGRFRACYFRDHRGAAVAFRRISESIPRLSQLHLPREIEQFAHVRRGLVLVTGATGSGKSTTLASIIDAINHQYRRFIITLEDPVEYVYRPDRSIVQQRGLGFDFIDFEQGVRSAVDQSPDVLLVGEMRDPETIRQAVSAAETGMLVFSTLHTNGAVEAIDRMIEGFSAREQPQIRSMLSQSLAGVVSQVLVTRSDGPGRLPATEVLVATPAVSNLIREGKTADVTNVMQSGRAHGMHTLDESLERRVKQGNVDPGEVYLLARNRERFEQFLRPRWDSERGKVGAIRPSGKDSSRAHPQTVPGSRSKGSARDPAR